MSGKPKYHVGQKTDRKEIVSFYDVSPNGSHRYLWKCLKCHTIYGPSSGTSIFKSPYTKCCQRRLDEKTNYRGAGHVTGSKMTQIKDSARKRNLECTVTAQFLWELFKIQEGRCGYTGLPIELNKNASLDRIDSTKGYTPGNVHWVLWDINRMKWNIPHQEFVKLCSLVASRNGDKNDRNKESLVTS